ncbi:putative quinol monooxygenase [Mariniradius sediminis]|uniref:Antibiotic biosynthesis monooxygenase n=1 Tax=Mariniradius sediminis TaxID=2909237 RepID=A0ABS9C0B4_9BACT|nr:putative quinol monooxygenase [Mariniradius sediminis]MCF1753375.1 antibiotic biosynthesis monooxygenase [Mariniradius sediminis]
MKLLQIKYQILILVLFTVSACGQKEQNQNAFNADDMMIRISEIEIYQEHLDEYLSILKEESEASVRLESGVISIYPMYQKDNPTEIRILEIYKDKEAYESHLQTPHFKHYKTTTLKMVKSLKLVDMGAIDEETMPKIFEKLSE